jgi:subtilase family serine protease
LKSSQIILALGLAILVVLSSISSPVMGNVSTNPGFHNPLIYRPASLTSAGAPPYVPSDIRSAYDFLPLYSRGINGSGTRIAIIDAYGSSSLSSDLASFDSLTGIPSATVNTFYPDGVPGRCRTQTCSSWAVETSLDVEWAHAIAPEATIDLVVALDSSTAHIFDAISYVANSLTSETVLSMSFGQSESSYPTTGSDTLAATHQLFVTITAHGTTPFASSGDSGASSCCSIIYPASDPLVVAVGGTSLNLNSTAGYVGETAWSGSGAGSSSVFSKPAFQLGLGDSMRDITDVSYDADPNTGVLVVKGGGEYEVGGTSAGSPQWAALVDLASQANATRFGSILPKLYKLSSFHDITSGSDGFFTASSGWDYPTGLGTPDATRLVNSLGLVDVAVTGIGVMRNFAYAGVVADPILVNVTVANLGTAQENLTVTFEANSTIVGTQMVTVSSGSSMVVVYDWNTQSLTRGGYVLSAHISVLPGEISTAKNTLADPTVFVVRMAGDVNDDCRVDISDLSIVGATFGLTSGSPSWNPNADLDNDGVINIIDLTIVGIHFGSVC